MAAPVAVLMTRDQWLAGGWKDASSDPSVPVQGIVKELTATVSNLPLAVNELTAPVPAKNRRNTAGLRRGGGRPKGAPNKMPRQLKDMILDALAGAGGVAYLQQCARKHPAPFLALVGKVLPLQVTGGDGAPLVPTIVIHRVEVEDGGAVPVRVAPGLNLIGIPTKEE